MAKWFALAAVVWLAAGLSSVSATTRVMTVPEASSGVAVFDVRRNPRHTIVRPAARPDPRYYTRPVYYRPHPYGVPAPFVFGYGPFW